VCFLDRESVTACDDLDKRLRGLEAEPIETRYASFVNAQQTLELLEVRDELARLTATIEEAHLDLANDRFDITVLAAGR